MRSLAAALGIASLASCILPDFEPTGRACPCTDGFVCNTATNTCVLELAGGAPATAGGPQGGQPVQGGDPSGAGGSGGSGGSPPSLPGLQVTGDIGDGKVNFFVDGSFKLVAASANNWQLTSWYDLANDAPGVFDLGAAPGDPLGRDVLYEPFWTRQADWYSSEDGVNATAVLEDQRPVRATLRSTVDYPNTPGGLVNADYTIYATGKVGVRVTFTATSGPIVLTDSEIHHLTVANAAEWSGAVLADGRAAALLRLNGPAPSTSVLVVDRADHGNPGSDLADLNWYWQSGAQSLAQGQSLELTGEMMFALSGLDASELGERAADAGGSTVSVISGASDGTFEPGRSAMALKVEESPVAFVLDADVARFTPAFQLENWTSPTFTIKLGDEVIASHTTPVTDRAIARYQPGDSSLVFIYGGTIPAGAEIGARTFSVEE